MGRVVATPGDAMVAGGQRANENTALTATHTLFATNSNLDVQANVFAVVPD